MSRESHDDFLAIAEKLTHVGGWQWDVATGRLIWSDELFRILGFTPRAFTPQWDQALNMAPPEERKRLLRKAREALTAGTPFYDVHRVTVADGTERIVESRAEAVLDAQGVPLRWVGAVQDVTERIHLLQETYRLAALVATSDDAIVSASRDGVVESWNAGAERLLGYSPLEAIGKSLKFFTPPEEAAEAALKLEQMRQGMGYKREGTLVHKDGTFVPVSLIGSPIRNVSGRIVGVSLIARDITERKRFEAEIVQLNHKLKKHVVDLKQANSELESFSYSLSHDLRTPLLAINGFSSLLKEEYEDALHSEGKRYIALICQGAAKLNRLIDSIQAYLRASRGEMATERVDMTDLARNCLDELGTDTLGQNIHFVMKDLPPAHGDRALIRLALVNLLGNAVKFTGRTAEAVIEVSGAAREAENVYCVKDNGAGFDMRYGDKLFEAFQRLHDARDFDGVGVGLAVVRRIIKRHGGRVWATSKVGEGAAFFFTLPCEKGPA